MVRHPIESADAAAGDHRVGGYTEYAPPHDLADTVEALWTHETVGIRLPVHRVVPDAAVSLCFMGTRSPNGSAAASRLRVIGPIVRSKLWAPPAGHSMASIRVKLEWCRPLLGVAPWEHVDTEPCYAELRPDLAAPLEEQLMQTTAPADALRLLVAFLRERHQQSQGVGGFLQVGMESLRRGATAPRVAELSQRLGITDRHLRRLMVEETGIAPRHFARIQRFHALLRASDLAPRPSWAELAAHHGYADQSHLIREVQDLAGVTPGQLHRERSAE